MTVADWLRDMLALSVTFGLTGWLLGLIVIPERVGVVQRTWLSLSLAVPATILTAAPALVFDRLSIAPLAFGLVALAAVASPRLKGIFPLGRVRADLRQRLRGLQLPEVLVVLGAMLTAWFAVLGPQLAYRRSDWLPSSTWVWYYWWLVKRVVAESGVPEMIPEWGSPRPFPYYYLYHTLHGSITGVLAGGADLVFLERYRFLLVGLGLLAAYALWRRWLPRWWACMAAILSLSATRMTYKFTDYWPETLSLVLVFWSSWLLDEAIQRRSIRWGALAGLVSASAYLSHAELWLLTGPLWLGMIVSRLVPFLWSRRSAILAGSRASGERGIRTGMSSWLPMLAACFLAFVTVVLVTGITFTGIGWVAEAVPGGGTNGRWERPGSGTDPTWALHTALYIPGAASRAPVGVCDLFRQKWTRFPYPGLDLLAVRTQIFLALTLLLVLYGLRHLPAAARRAFVTWSVYVLGVYVGSLMFCAVYSTYVPERAGGLRVMPNFVLALAGLLAIAGWIVSDRLIVFLQRVFCNRARGRLWQHGIAGVSTLLVSMILLLAFTPMRTGRIVDLDPGLPLVAYEAYVWIEQGLPSNAVILTNTFTPGTLGAASNRTGLLDGRAPYMESSDWLQYAIRTVRRTREFFAAPQRNRDDLPPSVTHVLVAKKGVNLGGVSFKTDLKGLRRTPDLRLVRSFGEDEVLLFEVVRGGQQALPHSRDDSSTVKRPDDQSR